MSNEIRVFADEPLKILLIRYLGSIPSKQIFDLHRSYFEVAPEKLNYSMMLDIRALTSLVAENDFEDYFVWADSLKVRLGLPYEYGAFTLLGARGDGAQYLARVLARLLRGPCEVKYSVSEAWAVIAPGQPISKAAAKFLRAR